MRHQRRILCAAFAALALAAKPAFGAPIETATGPVEIEQTPEIIAVFDIAALDTIDALGVSVAGVPDRVFLDELQEVADKAEVVGTLFEPDLEALNALGPDLVIVGGRSAAQAKQAERVAATVDMTFDATRTIQQTRERIIEYGELFGRKTAAEALLADFDARMEEAKVAAVGKGTALIVMTNGPKISVYGPGSRFGWLHTALGIEPAAEDLDTNTHGDAVSFEFVAEINPDWLIVLDRAAAIGSGEQNAKATLDNELVHQTTAWKKDQVIYLPAADFYIASGGARATARIFDTIAEGFSAAE